MTLADRFPPLYQCSECKAPVKVRHVDGAAEPVITRPCGHEHAAVWANRKVTLRGKGELSTAKRAQIRLTLTVRQFLSALTGRSI